MILGKISKEIVCTIKDPNLIGVKLFKVQIIDLNLSDLGTYLVAIERKLGLGVGDLVLMVYGSGARKMEGTAEMPVDCAITAKVEKINIDNKYKFLL